MAVTFTNIRVWDTGERIDLVVPDETRDVALDASALTATRGRPTRSRWSPVVRPRRPAATRTC